MVLLPASRAWSVQPAGPKIALRFCVCLLVCWSVGQLVCVSPLITCAMIISCTLLPCDFTLVNYGWVLTGVATISRI